MQRFTGRVAFITGAAEGIGRATADRIVGEGGSVAVTDINTEAAEQAARELAGAEGPGTAIGLGCDVCDKPSIDAAMARTVERFGRLDVLVNNVGIDFGGPFEDISDDSWSAQVDPTLHGAVRCVQAALPYLLESEHAAVVAIASVNGMAAIGGEAYSAAKAGVINLMMNLAIRYSPVRLADGDAGGRATGDAGYRAERRPLPHGIRFNTVSPGTVHTGAWDRRGEAGAADLERMRQRYPTGRVGQPADIAAAVAFLASSDAAWITGVNLPVDGGLLAGPQFPQPPYSARAGR